MPLTVTVVTPVFNGALFIEATIQSVLAQTYPHIEYMIVDGGSTDGTVEIARRYGDRLKLISEPDQGQSDAINKGWRNASGDVLAWLCADDLYESDTVATAVRCLEAHPETDWVYGSGRSLDALGRTRPYRHPIEPWNYSRLLGVHNIIIQPSVFMRRSVFERYGELSIDLHFAMDYEYWLRIGRSSPGLFCPSVRVQVKRYASAKTQSGGLKRLNEVMGVVKRYGRGELPSGYRHEWITANARIVLASLRYGRWAELKAALQNIGRYPRAIPRGLLKLALSTLPAPIDRQLRRLFVRTR